MSREVCCSLRMLRCLPDVINGGTMLICLSCGEVDSRWRREF